MIWMSFSSSWVAQLLQLLLLLLELLAHALDELAQGVALDAALAQLLLQLVDELLVLLHRRLDELDVLADALLRVGTLALLGDGHTVLGLRNLAEAVLYLAEGAQHVVDLVVLLGNNLVQRVTR